MRRAQMLAVIALVLPVLGGCGSAETSSGPASDAGVQPSMTAETLQVSEHSYELPHATAGKLSGLGVRFALPSGWWGRIYARSGGPGRTVQAGNFRLPDREDDGGTYAMQNMSIDDVLVVIQEWPPSYAGLPAFADRRQLAVDRRDLYPSFEGVPPALAPTHKTLSFQGVPLDIRVIFGDKTPSRGTFAAVNALLDTLSFEAGA